MAKERKDRGRLPLYLIFILIGMWGVFLSRWIDHLGLRWVVLFVSVALPLFGGGNLIARLRTRGYQRYLIFVGVVLLVVGAIVTMVVSPEKSVFPQEFPQWALVYSRWAGLAGLVVGLLAILVAVVRREEEIEEFGQRFRSLADHMGEGFVLSAVDGTILLVNRRLRELLHLGDRDLVGKKAKEVIEKLQLDPMLSHLDLRKRGVSSEYVVDYPIDGKERHFSVNGTPVFDRRGEHAGTLATVRDITDQVDLSRSLEHYTESLQQLVAEQTEKLRQSEGRLRNLLLHMNEGFMTVDSAFRIRFVNERLQDMVGVEKKDLVDHELFEIVESGARGKLLALFELADSDQGRRLQQEVELLGKGGKSIPVMVALAHVRDASEEGSRYSLVVTDVSVQKKILTELELRAGQLEVANQELKVLDRAKDAFLTNVTHELRTPLSTIRGYVEMLESDSLGDLAAPQLSALRVMKRNVERLGTLIDEMIDFSRMQIRGIQLDWTLLSMEGLVKECVASAQPQAIANDNTLNSCVPAGLPPFWGDHKRLGQVLINLLSNAVKFTEPGGSIQVTVSRIENGGAAIAVSDTGIGIEPAMQEKVFDKFFQADGSLARRYEGAGIGLSIARSIAEAHEGTISLKSTPQVGSTFTLVLPGCLFECPEGRVENEALPEGGRVVVIAQDKDFAKAVGEVFSGWGFRVATAVGGHEGVRLAKEEETALVVVDEVTTDLTASGVVLRMRQEEECASVPVLVLVGARGAQDAGEISLDGLSWLLRKPFTAKELEVRSADALFQDQSRISPEDDGQGLLDGETDRDVLVVDADADLLDWLEMGLTHRGISCRCTTDLQEGLDFLRSHRAGMVFLDIDSPSEDPECTVEAFLKANGDGAVYVMSGLPGERSDLAHVSGALYKPFGMQEIVDIVVRHTSPASNGENGVKMGHTADTKRVGEE